MAINFNELKHEEEVRRSCIVLKHGISGAFDSFQ